MKFVFLSDCFYRDYSECAEIEKKQLRPYTQVCTEIGGYIFAIPLRSNINHPHVLWTNKERHCGLDFSKAVIILNENYIDQVNKPYIRPDEFDSLRGKEFIVRQRMIHYIKEFKKAKQNICIERNRMLCNYSTLQYFIQCIDTIELDEKL